MKRRSFLAAALALPLGARAQPGAARIVWFSNSTAADGRPFLDELRSGLRELGYVEGRSVVIDARWGEDSPERVRELAAEIVASRPDVIVTQGPTALTIRRATSTIPVVFAFSGDPIEAGFVSTLSRPGGNLTGMSFMALELAGKRIELLREFLPGVKRIAALANPQHAGDQAERRVSQTAAAPLGVDIRYFESRNAGEIGPALAAIEKSGSEAAVMFPFATIIASRERIARWSIERRIPTISGWAQFAEGGNLMSYGPNLRASFRRLATFVDKVLRGAKPAEIPVELPSSVELVVNQRTARALRLTVPNSILQRADRVIE
jgi:putative tryptophan/tyrosine transport system substrate-binding protein